jgi:AAA family ATP:ADP antiporter
MRERSATAQKTAVERLLLLFSDVRAGEGFTALLLMANLFLLLTGYLIIKTVREALILSEGGAVVKSYAAAGQALLLLAIMPFYGYVASRVRRINLVNGVTLFFISNLLIFYLVARLDISLGVPFFLWVGIFNLFVVAQFWSFANDIYSEEQGKRLFPIIDSRFYRRHPGPKNCRRLIPIHRRLRTDASYGFASRDVYGVL